MKNLLIALALVASTAHAEFYTGNDLFEKMTSDNAGERAIAIGYIAGVTDTLSGVVACLPSQVSLGQTRDLVYQFMAENPSIRHNSADRVVTAILKATWPCQKKQEMY